MMEYIHNLDTTRLYVSIMSIVYELRLSRRTFVWELFLNRTRINTSKYLLTCHCSNHSIPLWYHEDFFEAKNWMQLLFCTRFLSRKKKIKNKKEVFDQNKFYPEEARSGLKSGWESGRSTLLWAKVVTCNRYDLVSNLRPAKKPCAFP